MRDAHDVGSVPATTLADVLGRAQVMDIGKVLAAARAKLAEEAGESLDDWAAAHRARIERTLRDGGFPD